LLNFEGKLSTHNTFKSNWAHRIALEQAAGPEPIMMTSYLSFEIGISLYV
jgi:hypothetical protein